MYDAILVATDGSDGAMAAAEHAVELASRYGATLHVLYVADVRMSPVHPGMDPGTVRDLVEGSERSPTAEILDLAADADVPTVEALRAGVPAETIREYATEQDVNMVVLGTHGRTGLEHVLVGSVAERVVRTCPVPVLTVRPGT